MTDIYRKRLIPDECIHLDNDVILFRSEDIMVTRWDTINPKAAFSMGISCYVINKGWKISKFFDSQGNFVYWYCDIIHTDYDKEKDSYVFTDLLADVIIETNGRIRVVDLNEFEPAFNQGLITTQGILDAMRKLDELLNLIYSDDFSKYSSIVEQYE